MSQSLFVCTQLNGFKYCYLTLINGSINCLNKVKWFKVFLSDMNNSHQYQSFVCTQLIGFKYQQFNSASVVCVHTVKWLYVWFVSE